MRLRASTAHECGRDANSRRCCESGGGAIGRRTVEEEIFPAGFTVLANQEARKSGSLTEANENKCPSGNRHWFPRTLLWLDEINSAGARRSPLVRPSFDNVQINHFVGSHCHGFTPLR